MSVTLDDIAQKVGVAKTTVSVVLNNKPSRIPESTRQQIREAAKELNYKASYAGSVLAKGKSFNLGMVCGDIQSPFFSEIASNALIVAEAKGYHMMILATKWDFRKELECLESLITGRCDGVMMFSASLTPETEQYRYVVNTKYPLVVIGQDEAIPQCITQLQSDWHCGMNEAIDYLHNKGHEVIGFVGRTVSDGTQNKHRKRIAFLESCREQSVGTVEFDCDISYESAVELGKKLANKANRPTALVVYSDQIAIGVIRGLVSSGISVPQQCAVIGIDGTEIGKYLSPALTTISQDIPGIVNKTVDLLLKMINGEEVTPSENFLSTKLIIRESA